MRQKKDLKSADRHILYKKYTEDSDFREWLNRQVFELS